MKKTLLFLLIFILCFASICESETMTYVFGGSNTTYKNNINKTNKVLNTISPDYFDLTDDGNLKPQKLDIAFINDMHKQGIKVTPFLSNHWNKGQGQAALLNIDSLTDQIKSKIAEFNLDGVNVDIENVDHNYRGLYTELVAVLRDKLPDKIITVAVAANPKGWQLGWHGSYDYKALSELSDYLMIMGYDESYYGGPAGPVASASFTEDSIKYALKYANPEKIVLGVPFFGRYWKKGASIGGNGITARDAEALMEKYRHTKEYFEDTQSAKIEVTIGEEEQTFKLWGGTILTAGDYTVWYDDVAATRYKLELVEKYGLLGVGSWALGQEDEEIWNYFVPSYIFRDINGHWALGNILHVYDKHWMIGRYTDMFAPEEAVTRAEMATILVRAANLQEVNSGGTFADTKGHWAEKEIGIARLFGFIKGVNEQYFQPDRPITRAEMSVLLDNAFAVTNAVDFRNNIFLDLSEENYAYESIIKFAENEIIFGYSDNTFRPEEDLTRAEAASLLVRCSGFGMKNGAFKMLRGRGVEADGVSDGWIPEPEENVIEPR